MTIVLLIIFLFCTCTTPLLVEKHAIQMLHFCTDALLPMSCLSPSHPSIEMRRLHRCSSVLFHSSLTQNGPCFAQAQDRCHRIGQTREVHIYRLVTEHTIEENILRKSDEKRHLDHLAIQSGGFNLSFLGKLTATDILGGTGMAGPSSEEIKVSF